jgi:hypothetical protein
MKLGDTVTLIANPQITGVVAKLPSNSAKRKRPRALVQDPDGGEQWFYMDELRLVAE